MTDIKIVSIEEIAESTVNPSVRNPASIVNTYFVTITNGIEEFVCRTHHWCIYACAATTMQELKAGWEVVKVYQPDTKETLNKDDLIVA